MLPAPSAEPATPGTRVPKVSLHVTGLVVAIRNQPVVDEPLGLAVPLSVAVVVVTPVCTLVVTDGAPATAVNCITAPKPVPTEFDASAQE